MRTRRVETGPPHAFSASGPTGLANESTWTPSGSADPDSAAACTIGNGSLSACRLGRVSYAALIGFLVFVGLGLVIYVLPVLLFMLAGGGNMRDFGDFASMFTVPAFVAVLLALASLLFAVTGYFVVLFRKR